MKDYKRFILRGENMNECDWIPVSERLPDINKDILVTAVYYDLDLEEYYTAVHSGCWDEYDNDFYILGEPYNWDWVEDYKVIAWKYPEPYKCNLKDL